jgi:hypothetical protein
MAPFRFPGPQCRFRVFPEIDNGTLCRQVSPVAGPTDGTSIWPELYSPGFLPAALGMSDAITAADRAEFFIIKQMPVYDSKRRRYQTVNHYVSDRTLYFGLPSAYARFATESDAELANTRWVRKKNTRTLRSMIEFNQKHETQKQKIFYRWVRKAYKLKYGEDVDVPELIRKGMSQELANKIAAVRGSIRVKKIQDQEFHAGGFNPRPIKFDHHYLLGTLSEHATGMAVDIDDEQNAQLTSEEWAFVEGLVGKHVNRHGRWNKGEADAEALWNDIKEINDLFVKKIADEVKRLEKEQSEKEKTEKAASKPVAGRPVKPVMAPLQEILGKHYKDLHTWTTKGFFHLPLELVLELHAHGFTWGATFKTNVDLHHFQLDI